MTPRIFLLAAAVSAGAVLAGALAAGGASASELVSTATGATATLETAAPGEWHQFKSSHLKDALPARSFEQPIRYISGPRAIVTAWSGGAYDTKRDRMMVFGGGHGDYCGNDWPAFSLEQGRWTVISGPSDLTGYDDQSGITPDGNPASRHSYNGLEYIPTTDEFFVHGGSLCNGAGSGDTRTWVGNPDSGEWTFQGGKGSWILGFSVAYDRNTDQVFALRKINFYVYNPATDGWKQLTNKYGDNGTWGMTGAIDADRRNFTLIGQKRMYAFRIESSDREVIKPTGDTDIIDAIAPGFEWLEDYDRYVAWGGGNAVYVVHPETFHITRVEMGGKMPEQRETGTYGRLRYAPRFGGLVLVNSINEDVYFLKLPASL